MAGPMIPILLVSLLSLTRSFGYEFAHHDTDAAFQLMKSISEKCPKVTALSVIGQSVEGRPLAVLEFSDNPGSHETCESFYYSFVPPASRKGSLSCLILQPTAPTPPLAEN